MKYGSVCSGIEAASVAWEPLGWEPVFFSEIEPFPSSVLAHHWPKVPNHGDMTRYAEWGYKPGSVDVLVAGTPCQAFSIAGLRGGLDDPRGNLSLIFARMVNHLRPRWVVWENVPGVLSSNRGRDFASIIGAFSKLGYSCAWRILDAQYFGVPQRRRRIFIVASLTDWRGPAAVLFEQQGVFGDSATDGKTRSPGKATCTPEGISATVSSKWSKGAGGPSGDEHYNLIVWPQEKSPCLTASFGHYQGQDNQHVKTGCGWFVPDSNLVRRLTPTECERLQGFPDDHTLVQHRGKSAADGPRYKAIGNSMAVPVMRWIGKRIAFVDKLI